MYSCPVMFNPSVLNSLESITNSTEFVNKTKIVSDVSSAVLSSGASYEIFSVHVRNLEPSLL